MRRTPSDDAEGLGVCISFKYDFVNKKCKKSGYNILGHTIIIRPLPTHRQAKVIHRWVLDKIFVALIMGERIEKNEARFYA